MKKKWEIKNKSNISGPRPRQGEAEGGQKLNVNKIVKILLESRGLKTKKQINEFLNPPNPYTLNARRLGIKKNEINKGIKRIKKAITDKENIVIYGDYDADGICATAVMWEALHSLGAKVMPFIPHRKKHGYGLNKKGINEIINHQPSTINHQPSVIITVDNGIVAHSAVKYANKKGIDVIITDHHQKKNLEHRTKNKGDYDLPKAHAIIHSTQTSGVGVAWFFAKAIYKSFHKNLRGFKASNSLELASIGTVTDMMPMLGINRSLVKFGLEELRESKRLGIRALCRQTTINQTEIDTYHIGYIIGPRVNAMGRLENALESLRLLCTKSNKRADGLALKLSSINRQRQQLTQTTFDHAKKSLKPKAKSKKILFISHPSYNQGVVGLVAGKLADEFYRPAVVISQEKEYSKGSVRSIKGFNILKALRKLGGFFEDLGGHPMAAGFTIKTKRINDLREKLEKLTRKEIKDEVLQPTINVDLEVELSDIGWKLFNGIEKFSPFGLGNPRPVFVSRGVEVVNVRAVGRERKHLKLKLRGHPSSISFDSIAFGMGNLAKKISPGSLIDICFNLEKNVWNGKESLQLNVKDIKACQEEKEEVE